MWLGMGRRWGVSSLLWQWASTNFIASAFTFIVILVWHYSALWHSLNVKLCFYGRDLLVWHFGLSEIFHPHIWKNIKTFQARAVFVKHKLQHNPGLYRCVLGCFLWISMGTISPTIQVETAHLSGTRSKPFNVRKSVRCTSVTSYSLCFGGTQHSNQTTPTIFIFPESAVGFLFIFLSAQN